MNTTSIFLKKRDYKSRHPQKKSRHFGREFSKKKNDLVMRLTVNV